MILSPQAPLIKFDGPEVQLDTSAGADKTIVQFKAPNGKAALVEEIWVVGLGVTAAEPKCRVKLARQTSAGTGGVDVSASLQVAQPGTGIAPAATALRGPTSGAWGAEPATAAGDVFYESRFHLQGGWALPDGQKIVLDSLERLAVIIANGGTTASLVQVFARLRESL